MSAVSVRGLRRPSVPSVGNKAAAVCAAAVVMLITWISRAGVAQPGLDPSWGAALSMGSAQGLAWGQDLVFTYGPLGFLHLTHYWYGETWTLALIYQTATTLALLAVLWHTARRSFGAIAATVLLVVVFTDVGDPVVPLAFAGALWFLWPTPRMRRQVVAVALALGAFTAFECLVKTNNGEAALVVGLIGVGAMRLPRDLRRFEVVGAYVGAAAAAVLTFWLAAGQPLGAFPDYLVSTASIALGYPAAQSLGTPSLNWQFPVFGVAVALGLGGLILVSRGWPRPSRVGVLVAWLVIAFVFFKEGFIRHDVGHSLIPFQVFLASLVAVPWVGGRRLRGLGFVAILVPFIAVVHTLGQGPGDLVSPVDRVRAAWHDAVVLFSPSQRRALVAQGRLAIKAKDALPARVLSALRGRTVWVTPYEEAVAWAYRLRWRPVPGFQNYFVYTKYLDSKNARWLRGPNAPDRILVGPGPPGFWTFPTWQPPQTTHAMICRYRPIVTGQTWSVLARAGYACGHPRLVRSISARTGKRVPAPNIPVGADLLSVRISGLELAFSERIRSAVFKPLPRYILIRRFGSQLLVPFAAKGPIVLRAAPASGFASFAPDQREIAATIAHGQHRKLRFDFYVESLRRRSRPRG